MNILNRLYRRFFPVDTSLRLVGELIAMMNAAPEKPQKMGNTYGGEATLVYKFAGGEVIRLRVQTADSNTYFKDLKCVDSNENTMVWMEKEDLPSAARRVIHEAVNVEVRRINAATKARQLTKLVEGFNQFKALVDASTLSARAETELLYR